MARASAWLHPLAAGAALAACDAASRSRSWGTVATGALDEPAHLLTAWLVWAALSRRHALPGFLPWVLVGSVAIDLDHLPLYLGHTGFLVDGARPPTHSLATVAVLVLLGLLTLRWCVHGGLAIGVALHFLRDLATGPGLALGWPVVDDPVRVPYVLYVIVVATAAFTATVRNAALSRPALPAER